MSAPNEPITPRTRAGSPVRRIAAALIISGIIFVVLWLVAFSMITSLLVSAGLCAVVVATSTISDIVEMVLDAIAAVIFGIFAVIAALFAAIFALFGF